MPKKPKITSYSPTTSSSGFKSWLNVAYRKFTLRTPIFSPDKLEANTPSENTSSEQNNIFLKLERQRKQLLLTRLSLVWLGLEITSSIINGWQIWTGHTSSWFDLIVSSISVAGLALSYYLGRKGYIRSGSWLQLVVGLTLTSLSYLRVGTSQPLFIIFMFIIVLASVLLEEWETIVITFYCVVFAGGLYLSQEVWGIYHAPTKVGENAQTSLAIFLIFLGLPTLTLMLVLPAKGQARLLQTSNQQLLKALHEVEAVLKLSINLRNSAQQQTNSTQAQLSSLLEVNSAVNELSTTAIGIAELADHVSNAASSLVVDGNQIERIASLSINQATKGNQVVQHTLRVTQVVTSLYTDLVKGLVELSHKNEAMQHILEAVEDITSEIQLLAVNATIEAAGAGDWGQRFKVIALQVRELAYQSAQSGQAVDSIVQRIEQATSEAVGLAQRGYEQAQELTQVAEEAGQVIDQMRLHTQHSVKQTRFIREHSEQVAELSEIIRTSTAQQRVASQQVLATLVELSGLAEQNAVNSEVVSTTAFNLEQASLHLTRALEL